MGSMQGIRDVEGEYVWIEGSRDSYLQDIRDIIENMDWKAGVDCL